MNKIFFEIFQAKDSFEKERDSFFESFPELLPIKETCEELINKGCSCNMGNKLVDANLSISELLHNNQNHINQRLLDFYDCEKLDFFNKDLVDISSFCKTN